MQDTASSEAFESVPTPGGSKAMELSPEDLRKSSSSSKTRKDKALPKILQWLNDNYEIFQGHATPKREVYADYTKFCEDSEIETTNAPAFGKLLRMVFPNISSRRLGRRGHTSHHYNHFRKKSKPTSSLSSSGYTPRRSATDSWAADSSFSIPLSGTSTPPQPNQDMIPTRYSSHDQIFTLPIPTQPSHPSLGTDDWTGPRGPLSQLYSQPITEKKVFAEPMQPAPTSILTVPLGYSYTASELTSTLSSIDRTPRDQLLPTDPISHSLRQSASLLPASPAPRLPNPYTETLVPQVPQFSISTQLLPFDDLKNDARQFSSMYRNHFQRLFASLQGSLQFDTFCATLYQFWPLTKNYHRLFSSQCIIDQIMDIDAMLYSSMLGVILPDLFQDTPLEVSQSIIAFSQLYRHWLKGAMAFSVPLMMIESKLQVATSFSHALHERAVVNQLTTRLRQVLQKNATQAPGNRMQDDWALIDSGYLQAQFNMFDASMQKIAATIQEAAQFLSRKITIEELAPWVAEISARVQKGHYYTSEAATIPEFLLRCSFVCSTVERLMTTAQCKTVQSFQLLFRWLEALLGLYLEEQEMLQRKESKVSSPEDSSLRPSMPGPTNSQPYFPDLPAPEFDFA